MKEYSILSPNDIKKTSLMGLASAVKIIGSEYKLAKFLGITPSHISKWKLSRYGVSPQFAIAIEALTNKKVSRHQLRPDIYPE